VYIYKKFSDMSRKNAIIIGAAGRDFHNFNTFFRDNEDYNVLAFTAAQIPDIDDRKYPAPLAGKLYPKGIPIYGEEDLSGLIRKLEADFAVFSYSDVPYQKVMAVSALVNAAGANFVLLGGKATMIRSSKPVIAVGAVRTGCGKSQTSRRIIEILMNKGLKVVAVRHPMPYGDLVAQKVQRFATLNDLERHHCTIEEMEEYEPHVVRGNVIYAGVDYEAILREAEKDPDGEVTLRIADVVIINKIDSADAAGIQTVRENIALVNPGATVIDGASPIQVEDVEVIKGKRVLVVEDGPTLTHGGMKIGAGIVAARKFGAVELVDPRPFTVGKLAETFEIYPEIGVLLPAMGYGEEQLKDLETTINNTDCDAVVIGTPIDLTRIIQINKPTTRVFYDLQEIGNPNLEDVLGDFLEDQQLG
jgi:predicted GTPase